MNNNSQLVLGLRITPILGETRLIAERAGRAAQALQPAFPPYRQRPDITLHAREPQRPEIPVQRLGGILHDHKPLASVLAAAVRDHEPPLTSRSKSASLG